MIGHRLGQVTQQRAAFAAQLFHGFGVRRIGGIGQASQHLGCVFCRRAGASTSSRKGRAGTSDGVGFVRWASCCRHRATPWLPPRLDPHLCSPRARPTACAHRSLQDQNCSARRMSGEASCISAERFVSPSAHSAFASARLCRAASLACRLARSALPAAAAKIRHRTLSDLIRHFPLVEETRIGRHPAAHRACAVHARQAVRRPKHTGPARRRATAADPAGRARCRARPAPGCDPVSQCLRQPRHTDACCPTARSPESPRSAALRRPCRGTSSRPVRRL